MTVCCHHQCRVTLENQAPRDKLGLLEQLGLLVPGGMMESVDNQEMMEILGNLGNLAPQVHLVQWAVWERRESQ